MKKTLSMLATASLTCGLAHAASVEPNKSTVAHAVKEYLGEHGDLCVAKFNWPRLVTAEDRQLGTDDAIQLPVMERLGLVRSVEVSVPHNDDAQAQPADSAGETPSQAAAPAETARSYSLTAKGQQFYVEKRHSTLGIHGQTAEHSGDLCLAHLTLDKVVKWTPPDQSTGRFRPW